MENEKKPIDDQLLTCVACGAEFVFSVGEQVYYQSKLLSVPRRCKKCRDDRKRSLVPDRAVWHD
jgi:hypothetical protein